MNELHNCLWNRTPDSAIDQSTQECIIGLIDPIIDNDKGLSANWPRPKRRQHLHRAISVLFLNAFDAYLVHGSSILDRSTLPTDGSMTDEAVTEALQLLVTMDHLLLSLHEQRFVVSINPDSEAGQIAVRHKAEFLDQSEPLNLASWSEHPEIDGLVDAIFAAHFHSRKAASWKKTIKVVLIDLYVRWSTDPTLKTSVSLNRNDYNAKSRYNPNSVSNITTKVVHTLADAGLLKWSEGIPPRLRKESRLSRIWPSPKLVQLFQGFADFDVGAVRQHPDREVIERRNGDEGTVDYVDTDDTNAMRDRLRRYNDLLTRTFIDVPTMEQPYIVLKDGQKLQVNQQDKFTRRIFNRGSFEHGGRFYGGWWQRCPEELRKGIFIDDKPTVELDYSSLHPMLLYAKAGVEYDRSKGDVYTFETPSLPKGVNARAIAKSLVLVAINAKSESSAFHAFRSEALSGSVEKQMKDDELRIVLDGFRAKHPAIAQYLASDVGIQLQNLDSQITDRILTAFTDAGIPVLSIHDSYIVQVEHAARLEGEMQIAFEAVTGRASYKIEPSRDAHPGNMRFFGSFPQHKGPAQLRAGQFSSPRVQYVDVQDVVFPWANPKRSKRYAKAWATFQRPFQGSTRGGSSFTEPEPS